MRTSNKLPNKCNRCEKETRARIGEHITCPVCEGSGAVLVYSFSELKEIQEMTHGKMKGYINIGNQRFKVYLHLEPVKRTKK